MHDAESGRPGKEIHTSLIFLAETYLGRPLIRPEQTKLISFHDDLGMDIDLIDYLLEYCITRNHTSFIYIEKVAQTWAGAGIHTLAELQENNRRREEQYRMDQRRQDASLRAFTDNRRSGHDAIPDISKQDGILLTGEEADFIMLFRQADTDTKELIRHMMQYIKTRNEAGMLKIMANNR